MTHLQYTIRDCHLDCQTMMLSRGDQQVKLSAKVFDYLMLFLNSQEQIVNNEDAIDKIWLGNEGVGKRGVTNAIWSLRKAFSELGIEEEVFQTIPKVGYQLKLQATPVETSEPEYSKNTPSESTNNRKILILLTALAVLGLIVYLFAKLPPESSVRPPVENTSITTFEGIEEHPAISNSGQRIAFQWLREGQKGQIYIKSLVDEQASLNLISMGNQEETSPAWSFDDKRLAYLRLTEERECEIRVRELDTNKDVMIDTGCYYQPFRKAVTWSSTANDFLIYSKRIAGAAALFKYDFETGDKQQLTFPQVHETDFAPQLTADNQKLVFIREKGSQSYNVVVNAGGKFKTILGGQVSIVDITMSSDHDAVIVNYAQNGQFVIDHIDLDNNQTLHIANRTLPSTISLNKRTNQLAISEHISKEYVALVDFETAKISRRVSSSSRDMYGRYLSKSNEIMFLSNRSGMWSVWLKGKLNSVNLTKDLGNVTVPAVSPDESQYVVKITKSDNASTSLYLGTFESQQLQKLDTGGLQVENLSWANDGKSVYFFSSNGEQSGIYNIEIATSQVTRITQTNEQYAIEAQNGDLFVTRLNQPGIWRFNPRTMSYSLVTNELAAYDYGAFYCMDDALYYVYRNRFTDEIKKINQDGSLEILSTFPKNTIRKYFGISPGTKDKFIATLKITNEADINAIPVSLHHH